MESDQELEQVIAYAGKWSPVEQIVVGGKPATAGSKKAFHSKKTEKTWVTDDCKRGKEWRATIRAAAAEQRKCTKLYAGPLCLIARFTLLRPKSHYRTGKFSGSLKASAPEFPTGKPDTTKLLRALEDALTDLLWVNDAQIIVQGASKVYGSLPGAQVLLYTPK